MHNIYEMNTLKTILDSLINLVAALWFIRAGLIGWPQAAVMTLGAVLGYYLGSHFSPAGFTSQRSPRHHSHRFHHFRGDSDVLQAICPLMLGKAFRLKPERRSEALQIGSAKKNK